MISYCLPPQYNPYLRLRSNAYCYEIIAQVVYCHGSFATATCTRCATTIDGEDIQADIQLGRVPTCQQRGCPPDQTHRERPWREGEKATRPCSIPSAREPQRAGVPGWGHAAASRPWDRRGLCAVRGASLASVDNDQDEDSSNNVNNGKHSGNDNGSRSTHNRRGLASSSSSPSSEPSSEEEDEDAAGQGARAAEDEDEQEQAVRPAGKGKEVREEDWWAGEVCGGVLKPDIVMFNERLPREFEESLSQVCGLLAPSAPSSCPPTPAYDP